MKSKIQNKANSAMTLKKPNEPNLNRRLMSDMQLLKKFSEFSEFSVAEKTKRTQIDWQANRFCSLSRRILGGGGVRKFGYLNNIKEI